jgi:hypothetical protein
MDLRQSKNEHPMPDPVDAPSDTSFYDREAIFHENGPLHPSFVEEAIRSLLRACPLDPAEPEHWAYRRMDSALSSLAALHPRDEIEVMLGVQAICAYHAANACWRIGMNQHSPNGDSTRHLSAAATAARTFETMLRALERRQSKPLAVPVGRPAPRVWPDRDAAAAVHHWEARCRRGEDVPVPDRAQERKAVVVWTPQALAVARQMREREELAAENEGLDIANTDGILPGGGMIVPREPTPQQVAYMARRSELMYRREWQNNLRQGNRKYPKIRPIRVGDLIP